MKWVCRIPNTCAIHNGTYERLLVQDVIWLCLGYRSKLQRHVLFLLGQGVMNRDIFPRIPSKHNGSQWGLDPQLKARVEHQISNTTEPLEQPHLARCIGFFNKLRIPSQTRSPLVVIIWGI